MKKEKLYIVTATFIFLSLYLCPTYASDILLEDLNCKVMGAVNDEIKVKAGSLTTSVCSIIGNEASCSVTAKDGTMFEGKPSEILRYQIAVNDDEVNVWILGGNMLILDKKNLKYYYASTFLGKTALLNKYCVGKIKANLDQ